MAKGRKRRPAHLAAKLLQVRKSLRLSQNQMIERMGLTDEVLREEISDFERGKRVPPLHVLLAYARVAHVYVDTLIDDKSQLPDNLPAKRKV